MGNWGLSISTRDPNPNPQLADVNQSKVKVKRYPSPTKYHQWQMPTLCRHTSPGLVSLNGVSPKRQHMNSCVTLYLNHWPAPFMFIGITNTTEKPV